MSKPNLIRIAVMQLAPVKDTRPTQPLRATQQAVGFDVTPRQIKQIAPNEVHCLIGWHIKPPKGFKVTLVPQSRFTKTNWVMQNSPGQVDPDYRGEVQFRFRALPTGISLKQMFLNLFRTKANRKPPFTYDPFPFTTKDTCGQIFLEKVYNTEIHYVPVEDLGKTQRGEGGFGSTKKNINQLNN